LSAKELAADIKLLLMDVDGVLTDGRLYNVPDSTGKMVETKAFDSQDGIALQWLNWNGIKTGLISGRVSPATDERARQYRQTPSCLYWRRSHGYRGNAPGGSCHCYR
jgi:3-deoxy-D-manno-octulosonate 8-phosphate phosphatase (KDO 8-P phosphatase)